MLLFCYILCKLGIQLNVFKIYQPPIKGNLEKGGGCATNETISQHQG